VFGIAALPYIRFYFPRYQAAAAATALSLALSPALVRFRLLFLVLSSRLSLCLSFLLPFRRRWRIFKKPIRIEPTTIGKHLAYAKFVSKRKFEKAAAVLSLAFSRSRSAREHEPVKLSPARSLSCSVCCCSAPPLVSCKSKINSFLN